MTLITGETVSNYSEAFRVECEARHVLTMPLHQRRRHIEMVEQKRGKDAVENFKKLVRILWDKKRANLDDWPSS